MPAWLSAHVGEGDDQIAEPVLRRARALYLQKVREGVVKNSCYFAMDATRPNDLDSGKPAHRFYVICEPQQTFRAISAGHGSGLDLPGVADFTNGRECAKNFGNALDSKLTAGGAYVTSEATASFKGYYRVSPGQDAALVRTFLPFDGEGDTANARQRAICGHAAVVLRGVCLMKKPGSSYANHDGYVPHGTLVDYSGGRSDGCTSWSPSDAADIIAMTKDDPTTLYIYPEASDINAVAKAVAARHAPSGDGLYWNGSCLGEIGSPKFWPQATLGPIIAQYRKDHPLPPPKPTPIAGGSEDHCSNCPLWERDTESACRAAGSQPALPAHPRPCRFDPCAGAETRGDLICSHWAGQHRATPGWEISSCRPKQHLIRKIASSSAHMRSGRRKVGHTVATGSIGTGRFAKCKPMKPALWRRRSPT